MTQDEAIRPQRDTRNPCSVCGWGPHMGLHRPALDIAGRVVKEAWDHKYAPQDEATANPRNKP